MRTFEISAAFRLYTKVDMRCSFLVTNISRIISTEDVNFTNFLATTLRSDLELLILDFALHFIAFV